MISLRESGLGCCRYQLRYELEDAKQSHRPLENSSCMGFDRFRKRLQ